MFNRTNPVSLAIREKGGGWNAKEPRISISRERRRSKIACNVARYFEARWRDEHSLALPDLSQLPRSIMQHRNSPTFESEFFNDSRGRVVQGNAYLSLFVTCLHGKCVPTRAEYTAFREITSVRNNHLEHVRVDN